MSYDDSRTAISSNASPVPRTAAPPTRLTETGWAKIQATAPGHVANVRRHVIDALTPEQVIHLADITEALLERLDPGGTMSPMYRRHYRTAVPADQADHHHSGSQR
jgi:hypothetical protein